MRMLIYISIFLFGLQLQAQPKRDDLAHMSGMMAAKVLGVRNTVKYPASAATARQALIDDGWDIRDGGAE